jgi:hypothetical protein
VKSRRPNASEWVEELMWEDVKAIKSARLLSYDAGRFPFAAIAASVFKVRELSLLHEDWILYNRRRGRQVTLGYADNLRLRSLLQGLKDDALFYRVYHRFVREVVASAFGRSISYSSHPKMRVHLAGTPTVSKWHRDADITGRHEQINVWVPFTNTYEGNSLWIESDYGRGDYMAVPVGYGQALIFDGGFLSHGTVANETDSTRVSLDFRFSVRGDPLPEAARFVLDGRPDKLSTAPPSKNGRAEA